MIAVIAVIIVLVLGLLWWSTPTSKVTNDKFTVHETRAMEPCDLPETLPEAPRAPAKKRVPRLPAHVASSATSLNNMIDFSA